MLFILERDESSVGWDEYDKKIIRAESAEQAREIANENIGDEGPIWTNKRLVSCKLVSIDGKSGIILESFNSG